jgi:hypothetical protein
VVLSDDELAQLRSGLAAAGLLDISGEWDSLNVEVVLATIEHQFGFVFPDGVRPSRLRGLNSLVSELAKTGARRYPRARMRLDLGIQPQQDHGERVRARRHAEYRLALALPSATAAVSQGPELSVLFSAASPDGLPVSRDIAVILQLAQAADAGFLDGAATASTGTSNAYEPVLEAAALRSPGAGLVARTVVAAFERFVRDRGGEAWLPPSPTMPLAELIELGYYDAHPEQVVLLSPDTALLPAVCLPAYRWMAAPGGPRMGTLGQTVFRRELSYDSEAGRLPAFTQHDVVWRASGPQEDEDIASALEDLLTDLAKGAGLRFRWAEADDPFFVQSLSADTAKRELRVQTRHGEVSVASVNRHGDHFTRRVNGEIGEVTGCAGVGLQRFVLAAAEAAAGGDTPREQ